VNSRLRLPALLFASLVTTGAAFAGASSAPFGYTPDPALQRETPAQLQSRVRRSCVSTQGRLAGGSEAGAQRGCGCYATRVIRGLDTAELATYRSTGIFNDSARAKAFAALDSCGLRRPA
jgi:hypothetical protein